MTKIITGNIWTLCTEEDWVVVTTNVGWRESGLGIMGAGLAAQALRRWNWLEVLWGHHCMKFGQHTGILIVPLYEGRPKGLLLTPTKVLNTANPHLSWRSKSSLPLIGTMLRALNGLALNQEPLGGLDGRIMVPLLGCQNGQLDEAVVLPLMEELLQADGCIIVRRKY